MDPTLKTRLHPESLEAVEQLQALGAKPYNKYPSIDEARVASSARAKVLASIFPDFSGVVKDLLIPGAQNSEKDIPVLVYQPENLDPNPTILVYFHGGGLVLGSRENVDTACKMIASQGKIIVVNVEYRLCPEHKFPAMMEDAECATSWTIANKEALGGTGKSTVGVGGDSAGGHISSSICHRVPGIGFQILVYPYVSHQHFSSYDEFPEPPGLTVDMINWFRDKWTDKTEDMKDIRLTPLLYKTFTGLPPALFVVAECDPLRDHSYAYQEKLKEAGVHTELYPLPGLLHGFFTCPGTYKRSCQQAYDKVVDFISRMTTAK